MTATEVDGRAVIADRDATSDITDRAGRPVMWRQVRELTLDDGTVIYGCAHCDYTSTNRLSIRPHLNRHRRRTEPEPAPGLIIDAHRPVHPVQPPTPRPEPEPAPEVEPAAPLRPTRGGRGLDVDALTRDRDHWRARAEHAERVLAALATEVGLTPAAEPAA